MNKDIFIGIVNSITFIGITWREYYGKKHILKDINITLENGVYGLIGPNGVGKTTFLHVLLSLLSFENGKISVDDKIVFASDDYIRKIGYLPQYPTFYPSFTAYDFLCYMCVLKDIKKELINEKLKNFWDLLIWMKKGTLWLNLFLVEWDKDLG